MLDVSSDGKYALAQNECYSWKERHDVIFRVFEVETKTVVFEKKFLGDLSQSVTWYVSAIGRFMPKHPNQVLLAHPQGKKIIKSTLAYVMTFTVAGFQIFDIFSGKLVQDFSGPPFDGLDNHVKISPGK